MDRIAALRKMPIRRLVRAAFIAVCLAVASVLAVAGWIIAEVLPGSGSPMAYGGGAIFVVVVVIGAVWFYLDDLLLLRESVVSS